MQGTSEVGAGSEIPAQSWQILSNQTATLCAPVLVHERSTEQLQVIWADAAEPSQMARPLQTYSSPH